MTLLQIGIGLADLSCCCLVMYLLMPSLPAVDFVPLAVIVIFGTLLGFASHARAPSGRSTPRCWIGLPTFDRAELVATLLLYRLLYFVAPFAHRARRPRAARSLYACPAIVAIGAPFPRYGRPCRGSGRAVARTERSAIRERPSLHCAALHAGYRAVLAAALPRAPFPSAFMYESSATFIQ